MDRDEKAKNALNTYWLELLVESDGFHMIFIVFILLQNVLVVMKSIPGQISRSEALPYDILFSFIFGLEIILKWRYGFIKFWSSTWNQTIFVVWVLEIVAMAMNSGLIQFCDC